ncbi:terminase small subunit [Phyllobacterium sp. UNC302MFCol5.2]|uniref:terminase small subunit n=1 Tax=Phyllobacterium sp. UNC302MFCol5.2 TaxID=1449065 RepID=UPI001FD8B4CB|nr:terminase small subunit [Phyllobacterium sp. UNC302MFCol5.2]
MSSCRHPIERIAHFLVVAGCGLLRYCNTTMLTARQEAFCRNLARGLSQYEAYTRAGYRSKGRNAADAHAARLVRNGKVKTRLIELKGRAAKRTEKTVASLVADLDEAIVFARKCNSPSAVVAAINAQAKLLGLEAPRQLEVMHRPAPLPTKVLELTEEEWRQQFSTPLGLPGPSSNPKPLKQIRAPKHPKARAVEETIAERHAMVETPTWLSGVVYLDDEP